MNARRFLATLSAALIAVPQSLIPLGSATAVRAVGAAAAATAAMLPGLAQAEAGKRVCSYFWGTGTYAGPNIGFATKVNKGASGTCSTKLTYMISRMAAMGGPRGVGSYVATYNINFTANGGQYYARSLDTCESFSAWPYRQPASQSRPPSQEVCALMTTNYIYAFAVWKTWGSQLRYYAN